MINSRRRETIEATALGREGEGEELQEQEGKKVGEGEKEEKNEEKEENEEKVKKDESIWRKKRRRTRRITDGEKQENDECKENDKGNQKGKEIDLADKKPSMQEGHRKMKPPFVN